MSKVVSIDSIEHAQSVLKQMRSRSSSARNYQTIDGGNQTNLSDFNTLVTEKGKEVAKLAESRQKEASLLNMINNPVNGTTGNVVVAGVSHTLKSDRYELSPSKVKSIADEDFSSEGGYYGPTGGVTQKLERMALNRPSKNKSGQSSKIQASFYDEKSREMDSDEDIFASDDDDDDGLAVDAAFAPPRRSTARRGSPPSGWDDESRYDSDDDLQQSTLTPSDMGLGVGGPRIHKNVRASKQFHESSGSGAGKLCQGTTSKMTHGVSNDVLSPHSSPDGGRIQVLNPVLDQLSGKESLEFADGLKYMMEASLNEGKPNRSSNASVATSVSMSKSIGSMSSSVRGGSIPGPAPKSGGSSTMKITGNGGVTSSLAEELGRSKGAVLKKGGMFVRAGGRRSRQTGV